MTNKAVAHLKAVIGAVAGALLPALKAAVPDTRDYDTISDDLVDRLTDAFNGYLTSGERVTAYRNEVRRAITELVPEAFYAGYTDAAGDQAEATEDDEAALTRIQNEQLGYITGAFDQLKEWRKEGEDAGDVPGKVEAWASMLRGVYAEGKLRGDRNKMLTFDGDDGKESCAECQRYKGQRHSAGWWLSRDLVRRNGNENFSCGRWEACQHDFYDDAGDVYA